jgi:hypothetical protein
VARSRLGWLRNCYREALKDAPVQGEISLRIVIGLDGRLSQAANANSAVADGDLLPCFILNASLLRFPPRQRLATALLRYRLRALTLRQPG